VIKNEKHQAIIRALNFVPQRKLNFIHPFKRAQ